MKRLLLTFVIQVACASIAWAAAPAPLTTLYAVHALTNVEASKGLPVAFKATVTYFPGYQGLLFVQDGDSAVFVLYTAKTKLVPGDRILVKGKMRESFHPIVIPDSVTLLRHGLPPKPVPASFDKLVRAQYDCVLVTVHAVVRTAELGWSPDVRVTYLQLLMDGGYIDAMIDSTDENALKGLLDAEVDVTGIAGGKFDAKMQQAGVMLHVASLADVKILKRASTSPWSATITPMNKILAGYHVQDLTQRIRVRGSITYYQPGTAVVLQDGVKSLWIETPAHSPLQIGDIADATGFPDAHDGFLALTHGEIQDSHVQAPLTPASATWRQLALWSANMPDGHLYDLVSIEGLVVAEVRGAAQDEYVLASDGQLFSAIYRHPDAVSQLPLPAMKQIPLGSRIRVTGICKIEGTNPYNHTQEVPFNILLRSFDDISVVAQPSLVNTRNLLLALGVLLMVVFAVIARSWALERKMRRQTAALAYIEQRRGQVLEDINGARPLAEILEEIAAMVSFALKGAPCWCEVAGGARLGNCPKEPHGLRIVLAEIPARSGPPLGTLYAGLDARTPPAVREAKALHNGTRLATLAIETRRLYSDLLHRSEFDQLTDIHNRFSLEKLLDMLIIEARENAGIFGIIYIDLDEFKQVNDRYGHHIGDLYLQEVTRRLKKQLRPHDQLARLGGDEFTALVPLVRSRAEVEEIAQRLERSYDEPFALEGLALTGTASVGIALYPQDGTTRDDLLNAADAAMYEAKNAKHLTEISLSLSPHSELSAEVRA
jgi:diguanylate cyclase (GGDEF)-like protein